MDEDGENIKVEERKFMAHLIMTQKIDSTAVGTLVHSNTASPADLTHHVVPIYPC